MEQHQEVFASQSLYRKVLCALSRPGELQEIDEKIIEGLDLDKEESPYGSVYLDALALMVLDQQISFCVLGKIASQASEYFHAERQAQVSDASTADFLFVPQCDEEAYQAILDAKPGTLIDPHTSCTAFVLLDEISLAPEGAAQKRISLKGPGIKETNEVYLSDERALKARVARADEYPCGIDMLFVDKNGKLFGLPRSSELEIFGGEA